MKLIPLLLLVGMFAVSGWTDDYSADLVKAQAGDPMGQYNLGWCYYYGNGVNQDYKEAVKWWTKSAEQGHAAAKEALERMKSK